MGQEIDYSAVLADLDAKIAVLEAARAGVRQLLGQEHTEAIQSQDGARTPSAGPSEPREIGPGTFHGLSVSEASRRYLEMTKRKAKNTEIGDALRRGGIESTSKNFYSMLYTTLARTKGFIRMGSFWALAEWYPNRTSQPTPKPKKKGAKRRGRPPKSAKEASNPKSSPNADASTEAPKARLVLSVANLTVPGAA